MTDSITVGETREENARGGSRLDMAGLPDLLGFHVRMAHVAIYRDFTAEMSAFDLTQKQSAVLELIEANPGVSQVDLAATLGTDRATMMAIVDRLQARDLVSRRRSEEDRRRQELNLTPTGATTVKALKAAIARHETRFADRFSPVELTALITALQRLHNI